MRIAVIGAGPAGLTAAYQLAKAGQTVVVFEAGKSVGGMARSFDLWGQRVDLGPHRFFSKDPRVNSLWLEVIGRDYRMVERQTRILYGDRLYEYPLRAGNVLANMGPVEAAACLLSYGAARIAPPPATGPDATFEDWVVSRFGRRLFEMFFKSYSEKLWGLSCKELNADFAAQRIKSFSLAQALLSAIGLSRQKHRTLADVFAYPLNGNGEVYERMARAVTELGGDVRLNTPVKRVIVKDKAACGVELSDGSSLAFDHVISTMPLTTMVKGLSDIPEAVTAATNALTYRNTIIVYLRVSRPDSFSDQWLYVHSPRLLTGRITHFGNWVPEIRRQQPGAILALEYWCNNEDAIWSEDEATLVARARREMAETGLVTDQEILEGSVVRIPRCYPVYSRDYKSHLAPVVAFLREHRNLWPIGRYGSFKYNNQDHSILMGLLTAEAILGHAEHDLWNVNADDEYQESSVITAEGLQVETRPENAAT